MTDTRSARFYRDLQDFYKVGGYVPVYEEDNTSVLTVTFLGPIGTPYESGEFCIEIRLPSDFPFSCPKVKFLTGVFHPNISDGEGDVCMSVLSEWKPATTLIEVAEACQALLRLPNPHSPLNGDAAYLMSTNLQLYIDTAQYWTAFFAKGPSKPDHLRDIVQFVQDRKNYTEERALIRLTHTRWDLDFVLSP